MSPICHDIQTSAGVNVGLAVVEAGGASCLILQCQGFSPSFYREADGPSICITKGWLTQLEDDDDDDDDDEQNLYILIGNACKSSISIPFKNWFWLFFSSSRI